MGRKHWIKGAIEHPGAFREKARAAGYSDTDAYARHVLAHKDRYDTATVRQANLARTLKKERKKRRVRRVGKDRVLVAERA